MYKHDFKYQKNNIPDIWKPGLNNLAETYLKEFQPTALKIPEEVDIEALIEIYAKANLRFEYLSHGQLYLGLCAFDDKIIQIYNPEQCCAEDLQISGNTIVIDTALDNERYEHRMRFTMSHEFAHFCMHRKYYSHDENQLSLFDEDNHLGFVICKNDIEILNKKRSSRWTEEDTIEWQANYLGSALLMPRPMVSYLSEKYEGDELVEMMVEIFNVSEEAAYYRSKDLGCYRKAGRQMEMEMMRND